MVLLTYAYLKLIKSCKLSRWLIKNAQPSKEDVAEQLPLNPGTILLIIDLVMLSNF